VPELCRLLSVAETEELKEVLAGTAAQPFLADGAAKMSHSIRGTASPALSALKYVKGRSAQPVSVLKWVREGRDVLFLPYDAGQIASSAAGAPGWRPAGRRRPANGFASPRRPANSSASTGRSVKA
jgi:Type IV secretion-system coupling protein DNA-binding domain